MKTEKSYIATQSPMINTAEDFWRMVWEEQSKVILMLNPLNDSGKVSHGVGTTVQGHSNA